LADPMKMTVLSVMDILIFLPPAARFCHRGEV
jgi:hypothetical protein